MSVEKSYKLYCDGRSDEVKVGFQGFHFPLIPSRALGFHSGFYKRLKTFEFGQKPLKHCEKPLTIRGPLDMARFRAGSDLKLNAYILLLKTSVT